MYNCQLRLEAAATAFHCTYMHNFYIFIFLCIDVCECVSNSGNLQQSPVSDVCIGASGSPCRCNSSNCMVSCMLTKYIILITNFITV